MTTIKAEKPQINKQFDIKKIEPTNVSKLFWEQKKITKGDVIDYYNKMSEYILPYVKDPVW